MYNNLSTHPELLPKDYYERNFFQIFLKYVFKNYRKLLFYVKSTGFCYQHGLYNFQRLRNACNKTRKMCCRFKKNITYQISYNSLFLSLSLSLYLSFSLSLSS